MIGKDMLEQIMLYHTQLLTSSEDDKLINEGEIKRLA